MARLYVAAAIVFVVVSTNSSAVAAESQHPEADSETAAVETEAGGYLRPNVVWFGEALPEGAVSRSMSALGSCDLFMSIGTSAQVYPAAAFIEIAKAAGARTMEINRDATPITGGVDVPIRGGASETLPELVRRARG